MKTLYIECRMGAAGDMLMGALYELLDDAEKEEFLKEMHGLFGPEIRVEAEKRMTNQISGTKMRVLIHGQEEETEEGDHKHTHEHEHGHSHGHGHEEGHEQGHNQEHHVHNSYHEILHRISHLDIPENIRNDIGDVFRMIGEAESKVHQTTIEHIHFHEVGSMDALADVSGCCILMDRIHADQIIVSPVCAGNGHIHCAHGILPVPAPATAEIMKGAPMYLSDFDGELLTPTGAALLKHFAGRFGNMPVMNIEKTGYGVGTRQFPQANCVRTFLGETEDTQYKDTVFEICCNIDDMTAEALGSLYDPLFEMGALDVWTVPVHMKKNRSGVIVHVLCRSGRQDEFSRFLLANTTTQGVRFREWERKKLASSFEKVQTSFGEITVKISKGYGIRKFKPEYEDVTAAAAVYKVPYQTVDSAVREAFIRKDIQKK